MYACRCGIKVHLKNGEIRFIEGNPDRPLNQGVFCAEGSRGIIKPYSPGRLSGRWITRGAGTAHLGHPARPRIGAWRYPLRQPAGRRCRALCLRAGKDITAPVARMQAQGGNPGLRVREGYLRIPLLASGLRF
jgi:hypothetical protein